MADVSNWATLPSGERERGGKKDGSQIKKESKLISRGYWTWEAGKNPAKSKETEAMWVPYAVKKSLSRGKGVGTSRSRSNR